MMFCSGCANLWASWILFSCFNFFFLSGLTPCFWFVACDSTFMMVEPCGSTLKFNLDVRPLP